jgi:hypothetical protein
LKFLGLKGREHGRVVYFDVLDPTEDRYSILSRCVRGAVRWQEVTGSKSLKHFVNVAGHGDRDSARGELDVHAKVCIAFLLNRQLITVTLESLNEMISIVTRTILDAEVFHNEAELNVAS